MYNVLLGLSVLVSIGVLVCYVLVLIKMFQNGATGLGIACIVLLCVCGIGVLLTLIMGWVNKDKWGISNNLMFAYTGLFVLNLIISGVAQAVAPKEPIVIPHRTSAAMVHMA